MNTERDAVAVLRPKKQCAENQPVQGALQNGDAVRGVLTSRHTTRVSICSSRMSTKATTAM